VGGKSWGAGADDGSDGDSGSSDDDDDQQQQQQQQRARKGSESLEMTVTFTPGLEKLGATLLAKKQEEAARKGDSVWDAYLRCVESVNIQSVVGAQVSGWHVAGRVC
jgi:hypothetical protein